MKVLDLFSGTGSATQAFVDRGHRVYTVDLDLDHTVDLRADVGTLTAGMLRELCGGPPDFIWASPPCTAFSVARLGYHWNRDYTPKSKAAADSIRLVAHTLNLIDELAPKFWLLENPRGMLRRVEMMKARDRVTVAYCAYGDKRMKPTDLWGGHPTGWVPRPVCKPGSRCHESSKRGQKSGTTGEKNAKVRAMVPYVLSFEVAEQVEKALKSA